MVVYLIETVCLSGFFFLAYVDSKFSRPSLVLGMDRKRRTKGRIKKTDDKTYHLDESVKASLKFIYLFFVQA